ncbi:esterase/lipase family protein [Singulisphaera rosea]
MADGIGTRLSLHDPNMALPWFREAAAYSAFALMSTPIDARPDAALQTRAFARHNHSVEQILRCARAGPKQVNPVWREQLTASGVVLTSSSSQDATIPYEELWISADYRVTNLERIGWPGLGVPLITLSSLAGYQAVSAKFLPQRLRLPATVVLQPYGQLHGGDWRGQPASLILHDPFHESKVTLGPNGVVVPLAADLTTPLAHQMIITPLRQFALGGLLQPEKYEPISGLFMRSPYQPGRIPVLFVHGLFSSPLSWLPMMNRLQADPLLRERYQFWFAYYPTGAPVGFSAQRLRQTLHELRGAIDPSHSDPSLDRMVVVGHSLGGVLSKQMIQSSGRKLEQALFTRPLGEVSMPAGTRETLSRLLYFEPEPSIARAIFICAPHRGSNTANRLVGRLSSSLVQRRGKIEAMHAEVLERNGPEVFQEAYRRRPPNGIDNLTYDSPVLKALSELSLAPGVPYHSIIASLFPEASPDHWTDGVVTYESAHLDGATSESLIRHNHFANETPEAAAEVRRILRLHIGVE